MTRSSGRPGGDRGGDRPSQPGWGPEGAPGDRQQQSWSKTERPEPTQYARVDFSKRAVALVIDVATAYFVGVIIAMIPFINTFLPMHFTMVLYLLSRDYFFEGRGVGKNLMGLQVIDSSTGRPADLMQSVQRNIILLAPFVVLQLVGLTLKFIPINWLNQTVVNLVNLVGMVYCAAVIPLEAYRAYSRPDGLRIGDEIAGTAIIEAPMDFKNIIPR